MADCPGIVRLAAMADGALARIRAPGGALTAAMARAVAEAAFGLGSGEIDLTTRGNLQIRGLPSGSGPRLARTLEAAGFIFAGEADRRRNLLLDPLSGLDPAEARDLAPLARRLDAALIAAPWIGGLSPKFSFALDGGGAAGVGAIPSDVVAIAGADGVMVRAGAVGAPASDVDGALRALLALAESAAAAGPDVRVRDLGEAELRRVIRASGLEPVSKEPPPGRLAPWFGIAPTRDERRAAVSIPVPVGRLDPAMLSFLAAAAEREGDGTLRLAPWSAIVLPGVAPERADELLSGSVARGFLPVEVARRLTVVACAGAPACDRAREPAKALGAAVLRLAAAEPARLPESPVRLHLSACPKGCAGSAAADLLMLGSSHRGGWALHHGGSPRAPGADAGGIEGPDPATILTRLAAAAR